MPIPLHPSNERHDPHADVSRRDFVALSVAGGLAVVAGRTIAALPVVETEVTIATPDGSCDAAFIHPPTGAHPGVLIWPDAFGLRPSMRAIARRLAAEGYAVLVPNPFYRVGKAPMYENAANVDFRDPTTMQKLGPLMGSVNAQRGRREGCDRPMSPFSTPSRRSTRRRRSARRATAWAVRSSCGTAAAVPDRVGAGASFHGGGAGHRQARQPPPARAEDPRPHVLRRRGERRPAPARREGPSCANRLPPLVCRRRWRCIPPDTAGAYPTCRARPARPSTTRPKQSGHGPSCSSSTGLRSPSHCRSAPGPVR